MSNRKVKIKVARAEQLKLLLEEIGLMDSPAEIIMYIEDNKETMKTLCTSKYANDWDFIDEEIEEQEETIKLPEPEPMPTAMPKPKKKGIIELVIPEFIEGDWNSIAWLIEAVWRLSHKSPSLMWGTGFFCETLEKELITVKGSSKGVEHSLLRMLSESYYSGTTTEEMELDLTTKLEHLWVHGGFREKTLSDIANALYKQ
ncbi:MAG: hypothetical protein J6I84_03340 [Bacilli bacterium]|nr:hypothetical protein [Bacilli bacterium]